MKCSRLHALIIGATMAVLASPALAHHSYSMFDTTKTLSLEGTVKVFEFTNPHSWIIVLAKNKQGAMEEWAVETAGPGQLSRTGWKRNVLQPGDKVKIRVHPLRTGALGGTLIDVTREDGQVFRDVAAGN